MARIVVNRGKSIWQTDCEAIVVTVNCEGAMGAGIARQCRDRYPVVYARYRAQCHEGLWRPGSVSAVKLSDERGKAGRILILAATKDRWRNGSDIAWVKECIQKIAFMQDDRREGILSVAMPPMGCGHGGLNKEDFVEYVTREYQNVPVRFSLYL